MNSNQIYQESDHSFSDVQSQEMILDAEDRNKGFSMKNFNEKEIKQDYEKLRLDLILVHIEKSQAVFEELIQNFDVSDYINEKKEILFCDLLEGLKEQGFPIDKNLIYYYSPEGELYVYCGIDPLADNIYIPKEDYFDYKQCCENPASLIHQIMTDEQFENNMKNRDNIQGHQKPETKNNNCRRTKERKIGYIIEKVVQWRKYYNGVQDENGKQQRFSLEDAAVKVDISKKSLDDYLLQIRFGRKYGFNFNEHQNDKVGLLRAFVRKHKRSTNNAIKPRKTKQKKQKGEENLDQDNNNDNNM